MPADLYTPLRLRLMEAGWVPLDYRPGETRWRSPCKTVALTEGEAFDRIDELAPAKAKEARDGQG